MCRNFLISRSSPFFILLLSCFLSSVYNSNAQDTLPSFSATTRGNGKVIVSWRNQYQQVTQISIQRSSDSLKNFTTLLTVPDPHLPENGAVDNRAPASGAYYRLFVVFENGRYLFTRSKWPSGGVPPSSAAADNDPSLNRADNQRLVYVIPGTGAMKP